MIPLPDQPLPDGWVYIEHPDIGRSESPVPRESLHTWGRSGWTEVTPEAQPVAAAPAAPAPAVAVPPRAPSVPTAEQASPQQ